MFIAALFTITKTWKQPKCPSKGGWIKIMWFIFTQWSIIQPQKEENLAICYNMTTWTEPALSRVQVFETPWTMQSMEFSRPEYWSG